jgi:hypothetical protein
MIAEPYICIKGPDTASIEWFNTNPDQAYWEGNLGPCWMRYADFEREKLRELGSDTIQVSHTESYCLNIPETERRKSIWYYSGNVIGYREYHADSESSRLLKRAEFLKAVCEKEGVDWLPKNDGKELGTPAAEANGRSRSPEKSSMKGIDVVKVLVQRCDCDPELRQVCDVCQSLKAEGGGPEVIPADSK